MDPILLFARRLRDNNNDDSDSKHTCPVEDTSGPAIVPLVGNLTFHQFATILAGACAIFSSLVVAFIIFRHATNYSNPVQQRQVLRIVLLVPWVAAFSFLIVWLEGAGEYLVESLDFGCAIALSSFLLLLCDYILSHPDGFDDLFGEGAWKRGQFASDSPQWLKRTWYSVLQFIPVSIFIWVVTCITLAAGVYCAQSNSIHFAHIWVTVIKSVATTIAILAILRFYGRMKAKLLPHKVFLKLFAFKGIIGLNMLQTLIISILVGQDVIKPTKYMTFHDIKTALPSLILACEMPLFAFLLFMAFPVGPYQNSKRVGAGPLKAVIEAFNLTDLLSAFVRGPMRLVREQQRNIVRQDSVRLMEDNPPAYQNTEYGVHRPGPDSRYDAAV